MRFTRPKSGIALLVAVFVVVGTGVALAFNSNSGAKVVSVDSSAVPTPMRLGSLEGTPPEESSWWSPITADA